MTTSTTGIEGSNTPDYNIRARIAALRKHNTDVVHEMNRRGFRTDEWSFSRSICKNQRGGRLTDNQKAICEFADKILKEWEGQK